MIYLDNAATTKVDKEVINDITYALENMWYNPSSTYQDGLNVKQVVENAREQVAACINAEPEEIIFTSCGSESNNMAIKGIVNYYGITNIVSTEIEHPSVYNTCKYLGSKGVSTAYACLDTVTGLVKLDKLEWTMQRRQDCLVSIMMANNEIGTVQDIKGISDIVHNSEYNRIFHVDAVQAFGHMPIDVKSMNIDLMSVSGHKFGLPKGIGFLYKKKGIELTHLIHGGHQEMNYRAGTENVPYIYALGNQVKRLSMDMSIRIIHEKEIKQYLLNQIYSKCEKCSVYLNGTSNWNYRLPNNLSLTFKWVTAEYLITMLDLKGICLSAGSACCSGEKTPSRVLKTIGLSDEEAFQTIRITIDSTTTTADCDKFVKALVSSIEEVQRLESK